jgi:hypothetical protein
VRFDSTHITSGFYVNAIGDTLFLDNAGLTTPILLRSASRVDMYQRTPRARGLMDGALIGGLPFLGALAAQGQPQPFMRRQVSAFGVVLESLIAMSIAGESALIGGWIDSSPESMDRIDFPDDSAAHRATAERLGATLRGERGHGLLVRLVSAQIIPHAMPRVASSFAAAGAVREDVPVDSAMNAAFEPAWNFLLFRRLEATMQLSGKFDVGLAIVTFGEPAEWFSTGADNETSFSLGATGYFALARRTFMPFESVPRFGADVGVGVGYADVDRFVRRVTHTPGTSSANSVDDRRRTVVAGFLTVSCGYRILPTVAIGLSADYVVTPSVSFPASPLQPFGMGPIAPGNASVGFMFQAWL